MGVLVLVKKMVYFFESFYTEKIFSSIPYINRIFLNSVLCGFDDYFYSYNGDIAWGYFLLKNTVSYFNICALGGYLTNSQASDYLYLYCAGNSLLHDLSISYTTGSFFLSYKSVLFSFIVSLLFMNLLLVFIIFFLFSGTFFKSIFTFFRKIIIESEQNLFSTEDFYFVLFIYSILAINVCLLFSPIHSISYLVTGMCIMSALVFTIIIASLPLYFIVQSGIFLFLYIKGVSNDNNILVASANDFMGILSTMLRYFVQAIRWLLFFLFFFAFQIFLYEVDYVQIIGYSVSGTRNLFIFFFNGINDNIWSYIIISLFRVLFELLDFVFVAVVQLSAFVVVLFWLLGFLLSSQVPSIWENFISSNKDSNSV